MTTTDKRISQIQQIAAGMKKDTVCKIQKKDTTPRMELQRKSRKLVTLEEAIKGRTKTE